MSQVQDSIKVVCRLRTLNKIEIANNGEECVKFDDKNISINVGVDLENNKYNFAFDRVFGPSTQQIEVYKEVAVPTIKAVISGFNSTIFAYGQTGAGKTWTMEGPNHFDAQFKGLIPRTVDGLFEEISESDQSIEFVIKCAYIEIYNEKLFDLLDPSKAKLEVKEDKHKGVFIQNCTEIAVGSPEQMLKVMNNGSQNRKVAFTGMNDKSSRSHSLFIIHVFQKNVKKDSTKTSRLYFVDLAGSEKVGKTGVMGQQLEEAKNINKSLSALGNVINALTSDKKEHVPYRDSKLTRILQESLGGNSKTTLIINCSMCTYNDKETLSTLRFGYRAKSIKNKAKVNEEKSVKELMILLEAANRKISDLKLQLKGGTTGTLIEEGPINEVNSNLQNSEVVQSQKEQIANLEEALEEQRKLSQEKQSEVKECETRLKSLLLTLDDKEQQYEFHIKECSSTFRIFKDYMAKINKYVKRACLDIELVVNSDLLKFDEKGDAQKRPLEQEKGENEYRDKVKEQLKTNIESFLKDSNSYIQFYEVSLNPIFERLEREAQARDYDNFEIKSDDACSEKLHTRADCSFKSEQGEADTEKRKMKIALSEPQLFAQSGDKHKMDDLQMSYIYQRGQQSSMGMTNSEKPSQQESFTEIETLLESLETKESHKIIFEELNYNMKALKKENEDLSGKIEKLKEENKGIAASIEEKYAESLMEWEERAEEYKNIIGNKDIQITKYNEKIDRVRRELTEEKVVSERFKKIIEANHSMKQYYEMEEKVRKFASERQKCFNELFQLRESLDEAELTIKQKEEHIDSLKEVMKELSSSASHMKCEDNWRQHDSNEHSEDPKQIEKRYNTKVYGTEAPNVVQPIRGGEPSSGKKKSTLRKKIPMEAEGSKQNQGSSSSKHGIGSYFKGFFG